MTGHRRRWIVRKNRAARRFEPEHIYLTFLSFGGLGWTSRRPSRWMRKRLRREVPPIDPTKPVAWTNQRFTYEP